MREINSVSLVLVTSLLTGCADGGSGAAERGDHVWKAQTDALDKAREVEQVLHNAARTRRERIERNQ